ncbi:hypothetical protein [Lactococcus lactis]|uniref:hypothetical protein n=1 Tax=Lactococcus lactis TaxID=1358 RepID=UPI001D18205B|nr:hypothetical protein [Lactococcus lactis]MCC4121481.1 hypothetical protein [Lactococcus lactis]
MKLREIIKEIPDDDWLKIIEQSSINYRSYIGRAPKKYIVGEVLDYEALYLGKSRSIKNYQIYRFVVKKFGIVHVD